MMPRPRAVVAALVLSAALGALDCVHARRGNSQCRGDAACQGACLQTMIDQIDETCCPDPSQCPDSIPTHCSRQCGRKFSRLFNLCHDQMDMSQFEGFQQQCEAVVQNDQQAETDECEMEDASSVLLHCAEYESEAAVAANLEVFCASQCFRKATQFLTRCAAEMASTGHQLMDAMVEPIQGYVQQCPPSPPAPLTCNTNRLYHRCNPDHASDLVPAPEDSPMATLTKCSTPCATLLLQEGMFEACVAHQEAEGIGGLEIFVPLIDACNLLEEDEECVASQDEFLTDIGAACGCDDGVALGGQQSECDAGRRNFPCSAECSDTFLPWFSECAWAAFGSSDPATMRRFSTFAQKCAATDARNARQETLAAGADPADECSSILNCSSCGAVDGVPIDGAPCGWCRRELHGRADGFCSSICETIEGECPPPPLPPCEENERVQAHSCVPCPDGKVSPGGADPQGRNTRCTNPSTIEAPVQSCPDGSEPTCADGTARVCSNHHLPKGNHGCLDGEPPSCEDGSDDIYCSDGTTVGGGH